MGLGRYLKKALSKNTPPIFLFPSSIASQIEELHCFRSVIGLLDFVLSPSSNQQESPPARDASRGAVLRPFSADRMTYDYSRIPAAWVGDSQPLAAHRSAGPLVFSAKARLLAPSSGGRERPGVSPAGSARWEPLARGSFEEKEKESPRSGGKGGSRCCCGAGWLGCAGWLGWAAWLVGRLGGRWRLLVGGEGDGGLLVGWVGWGCVALRCVARDCVGLECVGLHRDRIGFNWFDRIELRLTDGRR